MNRSTNAVVVGVFDRPDRAEAAILDLRHNGFGDDQIGVARRADETVGAGGRPDAGRPAEAASGAVAGGVIGGLAGAAASLLLPGIGPVIAGGLLAATLGGAAFGATAGGLAGAFGALGLSDEEAAYYDEEFRAGRTIVTVDAGARSPEATAILRHHGASDAVSRTASASSPGEQAVGSTRPGVSAAPAAPAVSDDETRTIELRGEQLTASKRRVPVGEVEIRKEVVTEVRTIEVPVTREVIVIERHGLDRSTGGRIADNLETINLADLKPGESIRIPITEEEVTVEKRPVVTEELSLRKDTVQETRRISETVLHEEARLEHHGNLQVIGSEPAIEGHDQPAR